MQAPICWKLAAYAGAESPDSGKQDLFISWCRRGCRFAFYRKSFVSGPAQAGRCHQEVGWACWEKWHRAGHGRAGVVLVVPVVLVVLVVLVVPVVLVHRQKWKCCTKRCSKGILFVSLNFGTTKLELHCHISIVWCEPAPTMLFQWIQHLQF